MIYSKKKLKVDGSKEVHAFLLNKIDLVDTAMRSKLWHVP